MNNNIISLTKKETEEIKVLHFKKTGLLELCRNGITEDAVIEKLGKVSAELEDLGTSIVTKYIKELAGTDTKISWSVDFNNEKMNVHIVE